MELGHDDFSSGDAFALMNIRGNAAAIVGDGAGAIGIQDHVDAVGIARERLVDRVVDNLVHHVVQPGAVVRVTNIHAGPLAYGIETLQHLDAGGAVLVG